MRATAAVLSLAGLFAAAVVAAGYLRVRERVPPAPVDDVMAEPLPADLSERAGASVPGLTSPVTAQGTLRLPAEIPSSPRGLPLASSGARWYFNWSFLRDPGLDLEFVPLVCGYPGRSGRLRPEALEQTRAYVETHAADYPDGTIWVVGNEIGYRPQKDGRTPDEYAQDFHACSEMLRAINPSWRTAVAPAILSDDDRTRRQHVGGEGSLPYLHRMLAAYQSRYGQAIPAAYFAATAHVLAGDGLSMDAFREQVLRFRRFLADEGLRDRGVVVTEYGAALYLRTRPAPRRIAEFMEESTRFLATARDEAMGNPGDGNRLVQRWAWFSAHPVSTWDKLRRMGFASLVINTSQTALFDLEGRITHLGRVYADLTRSR